MGPEMGSGCHNLCLHDSEIVSYTVRSIQREIEILAATPGREASHIDVLFTGVFAYLFEGDNLTQNVLFDISEIEPQAIYAEWADYFEEMKEYSWPVMYDNKEELFALIRSEALKGFSFHSSYGMTGWVMAKEMKKSIR
jgi:hypothetical protein